MPTTDRPAAAARRERASTRPLARVYRNVALLECADAATLEEVAAGPLGRHVVRRLSDTAAVVDHAHLDTIVKALHKAGYTPRISGDERG
ncbi:MAG TPA: hypothetical protein VFL91_13945 [Thermomicrobiales bacterium]|nr:hypothetical protein [Thermomicrobiales bacterium]